MSTHTLLIVTVVLAGCLITLEVAPGWWPLVAIVAVPAVIVALVAVGVQVERDTRPPVDPSDTYNRRR